MVIKALVAYRGAFFKGFERQKGERTVQGELEEALSAHFRKPIKIKGAGRTDAGVNAAEQVIAFVPPRLIHDLERERRAIDRRLPLDLAIISFEEVEDGFDPRKEAKGKFYSYSFSFAPRDVLASGIAYLEHGSAFSETLFQKALSLFAGTHDFSSFTSKMKDGKGFVRHIESIDVVYKDGVYVSVFHGDGFMTYMIRFMVGAALRVASGRMDLNEIASRLDSKERKILSYKAPAEGLTLLKVEY